jgi:predicted metal-dependent hydrolase
LGNNTYHTDFEIILKMKARFIRSFFFSPMRKGRKNVDPIVSNLDFSNLPKRFSPQFKRAQREHARTLVHERLAYWSAVYGRINTEIGRTVSPAPFGAPLAYGRVSIRSQKTRWGSCSRPRPAVTDSHPIEYDGHRSGSNRSADKGHPAKPGNLNFNWKIVLLPRALADYIIVHELCHLIEFNHSRAFWAEVARTLPNYAELRKELRAIKIR